MSKIRIPNKFGQTPNELLNDPKLSLKAKGLYGFMQAKPDDWDFSISGLSHELKEGPDAIRAAIKELEIAGWLTRNNFQDKEGKWDCEYIVNIIPVENNKPLTKKPYRENPHAVKSVTEKPAHLQRKIITKKDNKEILEIKKEKFDAEKYVESLEIDLEIKENLISLVEIRKTKRTATTQKAIDLIIQKLKNHPKETQIKMLQNSVMGGWTGVFEIKANSNFYQKPATIDPTKKAPGEKVGYADYY